MKQSTGNVDKAFAEADHVIKETLRVHRGGCHAIETRGIVAQYEPKEGFLTIWASCQGPHRIRRTLLQLMDMPEYKVRVIAPRVGGGFGPKGGFYPENFLVPWLAVRLGTAVKWIEDRHEHFIASRQERDQTHWVEAAFNNDGKIVGLKNFFLYDTGAYSTSLVVPWITLGDDSRALQNSQSATRIQSGLHQQSHGHGRARRGKTAGGLCDGKSHGPDRAGARYGPRRSAPAKLHPER